MSYYRDRFNEWVQAQSLPEPSTEDTLTRLSTILWLMYAAYLVGVEEGATEPAVYWNSTDIT